LLRKNKRSGWFSAFYQAIKAKAGELMGLHPFFLPEGTQKSSGRIPF
jgi:hypothetical protein